MGHDPVGLKGAGVQTADLNAFRVSTIPARTKYGRPHWEGPISIGQGAKRRHGAKVQRSWKAARTSHCLARTNNSCLRTRPCGRRFACIVTLLLAVHFSPLNRTVYADHSHTEYQVKAAYLFNFLKFVDWPDTAPADPQGKWVIGFIGSSPVGGELALLAEGKSVASHELLVKKFRATDNLRECNILFVSASEEKQLPSILNSLEGASVLTVADMDNFIGHGGMVQFVVEGDRVRMAIDVGATSRARLKVSSKLLMLAQAVTETVRSAHN